MVEIWRRLIFWTKTHSWNADIFDTGFAIRAQINELKKNHVVSNAKVASFFSGVVLFITSALEKRRCLKKCSKRGLLGLLLPSVLVFNPTCFTKRKTEILQSKTKRLLVHLLKLKSLQPVFAGPNLDRLCVRQLQAAAFCENYTKLYFDAKHLEKGLNRGWWNFWCFFFKKNSALLGQYWTLP